jgi:hypothetical protein
MSFISPDRIDGRRFGRLRLPGRRTPPPPPPGKPEDPARKSPPGENPAEPGGKAGSKDPKKRPLWKKWMMIGIGAGMIALGAVTPGPAPFAIIGCVLIARESVNARRMFARIRRWFPVVTAKSLELTRKLCRDGDKPGDLREKLAPVRKFILRWVNEFDELTNPDKVLGPKKPKGYWKKKLLFWKRKDPKDPGNPPAPPSRPKGDTPAGPKGDAPAGPKNRLFRRALRAGPGVRGPRSVSAAPQSAPARPNAPRL